MGREEKFNTADGRAEVFKTYRDHRHAGLSIDSFPLCDSKTLKAMFANHPQEFSQDDVDQVEREYRKFWEQKGIEGMLGKINDFQGTVWGFNMKNRFKWSDRNLYGGADESYDPLDIKIKLVE